MGLQMLNISRKTAVIVGALVVGLLLAAYAFNVPWSTLVTLSFFGFFVWMHVGGHGMHGGGHGGHSDDSNRDEHAGHSADAAPEGGAKSLAPDSKAQGLPAVSNARGLTKDMNAKSIAREEPRRHSGC